MDRSTASDQRMKEKLLKRQLKAGHNVVAVEDPSAPIHCACLIHSNGYDWSYVDRLYSMLSRHLSRPVLLHVYTEDARTVPAPYIKHSLVDWGIAGPKKSWWYKLQIFNTDYHSGPMLYFDLDTVIVKNIDWIWKLNLQYFWTVRDFKYLWRTNYTGSNTSVMWWDTARYNHIWEHVKNSKLPEFFRRYHGDQDYVSEAITLAQRRFFDQDSIKSWRWQCLDGGFNFGRRIYLTPGTGTYIDRDTSILVFHGQPKPHQVSDLIIKQHWQ